MALIIGTPAAETLAGGAANDTVVGEAGDDKAFMGAGNDLFVWDPGDGNDTVEGQAGIDTLRFNSAGDADLIAISAAGGGRISLSEFVDAVKMDLNDVERLQVSAAGGADQIFVEDLTGTDAKLVIVDLAGVPGTSGGDGASDTVFVNGNSANNSIAVGHSGKAISVTGVPAQTLLTNAEAGDFLAVTSSDGNDKVNASTLAAGAIQLFVFGGNGDDTIVGSLGADNLQGQAGNDVIVGNAGADTLSGGDDNDSLIGGKGDDQLFGEIGTDRFIWNSGDGTDLFEGGDGVDFTEVNGGKDGEVFTVTANGTRVRFDVLSPVATALDIGTMESLVIKGNAGNDSFSATGNLAALIALTMDGGLGNDTILGGNGADMFLGGDGNDFIDGQQGNDLAFLGAGNDVFQWDPGDGSDIVEGQAGIDRLLFNGSAGAEIFQLSANGGRALLTRNLGNIVMDLDDVEVVQVKALGGSDSIVVNNLKGTDVKQVQVDLAVGGGGDGAVDTVTANVTEGKDIINVVVAGGGVSVLGLSTQLTVSGAESFDEIQVNGLGGTDVVSAWKLASPAMLVHLDGGVGNDTVVGSNFGDLLFGGSEDDLVIGGKGDDQMFGDFGNDRFIWNAGDGTDLIEGGDGTDKAEVNGGKDGEVFTVTANGTRVRFDILSPVPSALDIGTTESLVIKGNAGNDAFSATGNLAALIALTMDGGAGNDTILGGNGSDTLIGGDGNDFIDGQQGNDLAFLGGGNDVFQWDPGDGSDIVEGQAGIDGLLFNGSAGAEIFNISANGVRTLLTRNLGNIVMDLNDVERIDLQALGGIDSIVVNSLAGTDAKLVAIDLAGVIGGTTGDASVDTVTVNAANGGNTINVGFANGAVVVSGPTAQVTVSHAEASDGLVINGLAGNDVINASKLPAAILQLTVDGGIGNDSITGSAGNDTLFGGSGNDTLFGNGGDDILLGGDGNDFIGTGDGNDTITGGLGNDTIGVGPGNDTVLYTSAIDGHDVLLNFDGDAAGGQDVLDLDALFDGLGVLEPDRAARVAIVDKGAQVNVAVDVDGNVGNGFEVTVATLNTADTVTVGADVLVGS